MSDSGSDLEAAIKLRAWAESRSVARKRARTLAGTFGRVNLTKDARKRLASALEAAGLETQPSLLTCDRDDWLTLTVVGDPVLSSALPSQLVTWHAHNWTGTAGSGPTGEWLRCLSDTRWGDRQFIWSADKVAGLVTYAGWIRRGEGFYEGWGSIARLRHPVDRCRLLKDGRTASRFDNRGIKALQGSPIRLPSELADALSEMAGGVPTTRIPLDAPDYKEEPILWAGLHGLGPEAHIEAAVASRRGLWRKLGFDRAPDRQRVFGSAGRVDLTAGDVVGEAKRVVSLRDGPDQIERYLLYLETARRRPRACLRGVLLQVAPATSQAVIERVRASRYNLELWSVSNDGQWRLERLA